MAQHLLKVRVTGKVAKIPCASEDELFERLGSELETQVADTAGLGDVSGPLRNYEAIEIVHSRLEVVISEGLFKKRRGGIDVRRSGEYEAWLGGASKQLVEPRPDESVTDALRREMTA